MIPTSAKFYFGISVLCILAVAVLLWERNNPWRLSFHLDKSRQITTNRLMDIPAFLEVPSANIHLPVIPAEIKKNNWETTNQGISFLTSSTVPGRVGNSIMYGHNWTNLLGNLTKVRPGQSIWITTTTGIKYEYEVAFVATVTPDETHILAPTSDKRLTLYTCTGFFDTKRLVVTAIQKETQPIAEHS